MIFTISLTKIQMEIIYFRGASLLQSLATLALAGPFCVPGVQRSNARCSPASGSARGSP